MWGPPVHDVRYLVDVRKQAEQAMKQANKNVFFTTPDSTPA